MFTGTASEVREVESFLTRLPFAPEYSLAMTVYDKRDFGLVDVIAAGCSKGATLAEWVRRRGWSRDDVMAIWRQSQRSGNAPICRASGGHGKQRAGVEIPRLA